MAKDKATTGKRWWVTVQHQDILITESSERPAHTVDKGERFKKVKGPFANQAEAEKVRDDHTARTLRAQAGK